MEFQKSFFIFQVDDVCLKKDSLFSAGNSKDSLPHSIKNFQNLFQRVAMADDEDQLVDDLFHQKYEFFK